MAKTAGVENKIVRMVVAESELNYIKYNAVCIEEQLPDLKKYRLI